MILTVFAIQVAAAAPDIEFRVRVQARQVTIEKQGEASLTVRASPDAGSRVDVRAPAANGRKTLRNVAVDITAEARLADPRARAATLPPQ